ncbi:hypothetical protein AV530_017262 [Patagioenas fasciata monilis]|uniref:Uncharacterized protein n=1 Tax=Patagioenas fasciata monilis TaxID=372326 RepID=A0A1V4JFH7_PATFA|nr:hypothetical protein AV530_017262 [Patagioenas fasciata monilis]
MRPEKNGGGADDTGKEVIRRTKAAETVHKPGLEDINSQERVPFYVYIESSERINQTSQAKFSEGAMSRKLECSLDQKAVVAHSLVDRTGLRQDKGKFCRYLSLKRSTFVLFCPTLWKPYILC